MNSDTANAGTAQLTCPHEQFFSLPLADVLGHEVTDKRIDILRRIGEVGSI